MKWKQKLFYLNVYRKKTEHICCCWRWWWGMIRAYYDLRFVLWGLLLRWAIAIGGRPSSVSEWFWARVHPGHTGCPTVQCRQFVLRLIPPFRQFCRTIFIYLPRKQLMKTLRFLIYPLYTAHKTSFSFERETDQFFLTIIFYHEITMHLQPISLMLSNRINKI